MIIVYRKPFPAIFERGERIDILKNISLRAKRKLIRFTYRRMTAKRERVVENLLKMGAIELIPPFRKFKLPDWPDYIYVGERGAVMSGKPDHKNSIGTNLHGVDLARLHYA